MKKFNFFLLKTISIIILLIASYCKKEDKPTVPILTTSSISSITGTTAISGGSITSDGGATILTRGVCWSTAATPTISDNKTSDGAGAGNFSSTILDLNGATSYFVRAYATNSSGTGYGMAMSFKTLGQAPINTTLPPTLLTNSSATLNGTVNPNYLSTTVTFEYGSSTSYGQTALAFQNPLTGNSNSNVTASITGLSAGTTYHFRIKAENSLGINYSNDLSFTTLGQTPTASTQAATNLNTTSATLNGIVNPNYLSTTITFEYGMTTSYGQTIAATQSPASGNTNSNVNATITGLIVGTTYHFRIKTINTLGTTFGNDLSFTTLGQVPTAIPQVATSVTTTSATLNGIVNANFLPTTVTYEFGTTLSYGQLVAASQNPVTGNSNTNVSANITGLSVGSTYHFRIKAENTLGTIYSSDITFSTLGQVPTVTTQAATNPTITSATLNASVNANYLYTTVSFEYGTTNSYGQSETAIQNPISGNTFTNVSAAISGLSVGTTYHFRIKAENELGIIYGNDMTFTTLGNVPSATSLDAINVLTTTASLNGSVNANNLPTSITFEYGISNSYGQTAVGAPSPVTGSSLSSISANLSGLTENTIYYFRIRAENILGITYGNGMTFRTLGTLIDIDGNIYLTKAIGTQEWMIENLKATHYQNGIAISTETWGGPSGAYGWYYNDEGTYKNTYGALYNFYAVSTGNLCPTGWHVPTSSDWTTLATTLGGNDLAGGKLKEAGLNHWLAPNTDATNESGFNALPGGARSNTGNFNSLGSQGSWWSNLQYDDYYGWTRYLSSNDGIFHWGYTYKIIGLSVRCVKD